MDNIETRITFLTLKQFAEKNEFISYGALRVLVHKDKVFEKACIRRLGKRVLINEGLALKYIDTLSK